MIYIPKQLKREAKTKQGFGGLDVIVLFLTLVFSFTFRGFTVGLLQYIFPFFVTGVAFWLLLPSKHDYLAKNYQVMLQALRFSKQTFVAETNDRERSLLMRKEEIL